MNMDDEEETTVSDEERKQDRSGPYEIYVFACIC